MSEACEIRTPQEAYTDALAEQFAKEAAVRPRPKETLSEIDERGAFIRQANAFRGGFGNGPNGRKAEAGRYAIYWSKGCNWSNRQPIVRDLLGLNEVIQDHLVTHTGETNVYGWGFADSPNYRDPITGVHFLSEFYFRVDPEYGGRATTPSLVDVKEKKIISNDYHRMSNYLEVWFRPFQAKDAPDLYPKAFRKEIDEFNDWLFPHINNGHYRMAFCQSLQAYNEGFEDFYASMDKLEERLSANRFLFGDYVTDSDVRFFVTLARWDISYFRNVGPVKHRIVDYPNIWAYAREHYAIPAFRNNTYFKDLARGRGSKDRLFADYNTRIASQIDFEELWRTDNSRSRLSRTPEDKFFHHPAEEDPADYYSEISETIWNSPDPKDRDPRFNVLSVDPAVNPLKGKW